MGWKSTKELLRKDALDLVNEYLETLTNAELGMVLGEMFGETSERPYYGCNFSVYNDGDLRFDEYGNLRDECK